MTRKWIRSTAAGALALGLSAAVAGAQTFGYSTSGVFTSSLIPSCNGTNVCGPYGQNLTFTGTSGNSIASGSSIDLGSFGWAGNFSATATDVMFTINVTQTSPTGGTGSFIGAITGTIRRMSPNNFSSLVWTPNQTIFLSPVNYTLTFDTGAGGVLIPFNGGAVKAVGTISAVPEPASMALLATGLIGLGGIAVRRRRTQS